MNFRVLDEAANELADAIARYESIESGLGVRLKEEVRSVVGWITQFSFLSATARQRDGGSDL